MKTKGPSTNQNCPSEAHCNQLVGSPIARKRSELNLTQAQLAERVCISSKSVSKWNLGKCMPDYAVVNELCDALGITVNEPLDGEENERENLRMYNNSQTVEMLARIQRPKSQRITIIAIARIVMGISLFDLSPLIGGSDLTDFSSMLFGIGIGVTSVGVFLTTCSVFAYLAQEK